MELWNDALVATCEGQSRRRLSHPRLSANTAMLRTACFLCVIGHRELLCKAQDDPPCYNNVFRNGLQQVLQRVRAVKSDSEVSWRALLAKLWRLHRLQIFDNPRSASLDYGAMLQPGQVSIIDLSDTDSSQVNNLVIAQLGTGSVEWGYFPLLQQELRDLRINK